MTPIALHPPGHDNHPVISPMTSLLKVMPNLKCLKVNREQVWVSQSPGDSGEINISLKHVK
ncbi:MAG TPA: hypothetical protein VGO47_04930, partial [Chlamydiales bacterium]|nr:hypothetical protein [Chlamydiales bacterium]